MKGTLKLQQPILVDGKNIDELTYDTDEITVEMFVTADRAKMSAGTGKGIGISGISVAAELDYDLQMYLGLMAVIAVNPQFALTDLERIKGGADVMSVMRIGRGFITSRSEETSSPDASDSSSGNTPNDTIPLFSNSESSD